MKKTIFYFLIIIFLLSIPSCIYAGTTVKGEQIMDFEGKSLPILNERLRKIEDKLWEIKTDDDDTSPGYLETKVKNSVEIDNGSIQLKNDSAAPSNKTVYGKTEAGVQGWKSEEQTLDDVCTLGATTNLTLSVGSFSADGVCSRTHLSTVYDAFIGRNAYITDDVIIYDSLTVTGLSSLVGNVTCTSDLAINGSDLTSTGDLRFKVNGDSDDYLYLNTTSNIAYLLPVDDSTHIIGKTGLVFAEGWFDKITTDNDLTLNPLGNDVIFYKGGTADAGTTEYNSRDAEFLGSALITTSSWIKRFPTGIDEEIYWRSCASSSDGSTLIVGVSAGRLYISSDYGVTWTERQPAGDVDEAWYGLASDSDGSNLIVSGVYGRVWTSVDSGANWTERRPTGEDVDRWWDAVDSDSDGSNLMAAINGKRLYTSANSGVDWTERQPDGNRDRGWRVAVSNDDGSFLMAAWGPTGRAYTSDDSGATWTERQPLGDIGESWYSGACDSDGSNLIIAATNGRIYTSANYGVDWTERRPSGYDGNFDWRSCTSDADGSHLFVCRFNGRVYSSSDSGVTWAEEQPSGDNYIDWHSVACGNDGSNAIAVASDTTGGVWTLQNTAVDRKITQRLIPEGNLATPKYRLGFLDNNDSEFISFDGLNQRLGVGVIDPDTKTEILHAGTQLKLSYDATNYITLATQSDGDLTLDSNKTSYDLDFGDGNLITTGTFEAGPTGLDSLCVRDKISTVGNAYIGGNAYITGDATIGTGQHLTLGTTQWDNGADKIDGEQIADNTIDEDSIDWGTGTDQVSAADVPVPVLDTPTYDNLGDAFKLFTSAGRISGGAITQHGGDATVDVAAGQGVIRIADDDTSAIKFFTIPATTEIGVAAGETKYIVVDYNTGTEAITVTAWAAETWDKDTEFPLGKVVNDGGELHIINNPWWVGDAFTNVIERMEGIAYFARDERGGGLLLSVSDETNREIAVTGGTVWSRLNEFETTTLDTDVTGTFHLDYESGDGVWTGNDVTAYTVDQWNNVTTHALVNLTNNYYMNMWVYVEPDAVAGEQVHMVYGQSQNKKSAVIEAEAPPTNLPSHITETCILIGRIIIKEGVNAPVSVQTVFTTQFTASQAADHCNLTNLAWGSSCHTGTASNFAGFDGAGDAEEYPEVNYLLTDGTRALAGNWALGGYNLTGGGSIAGTDLTLSGDLALNGGDITSTSSNLSIQCGSQTTAHLAIGFPGGSWTVYPSLGGNYRFGYSSKAWLEGWFYKIASDGDLTLDPATNNVILDNANLQIKSNYELRFYDNGNYVGFEAPALAADKIWVLPNADGTIDQALKTDGSGNLGWVTVVGGGDLLADGSVPLTADWDAGNSLYDITAVEFKGALKGNADTVTNATLTTALTVNTGTLTLIANAANNSVLTLNAGASAISGMNTGDNTVCTSGAATTAETLKTARAINGIDFNGSQAITVTADANTLSNTTLKSTILASSLTSVGTIDSLVATTADINAGTFDGIVGGTTPAAITGTTIATSGANDMTVANGNLVIGTSGKGIDFSATSDVGGMTSELLDDYEEGTFTPGVSFGYGTTGITYMATYTFGAYTKVGNMVHAEGRVLLSSKGSSTGAARVTGLPFTTKSGNRQITANVAFSVVSFANQFECIVETNNTTVYLQEITEAGATSALTDANFADISQVWFSITYSL